MIADIRSFYRSKLGRQAKCFITSRLSERLDRITKEQDISEIAAYGYVSPWRHLMPEKSRLTLLQPTLLNNKPQENSAICDARFPLPDLSMQCFILLHGLETSHHAQGLIREIWRILVDGGRLIVIAPNRRGLWARAEHTPFGHGVAYSPTQLHDLIESHFFTTLHQETFLFIPPWQRIKSPTTARFLETVGKTICPSLGGLCLHVSYKGDSSNFSPIEPERNLYQAAISDRT